MNFRSSKFIAIAFIFLASASFAFSQSASYDLAMGPVLPTKKNASVDYFGISNGAIYKFGNENKKLEYQRLGTSLSPEATAPVISADDEKNNRSHAFTVMLNDEICKFTFSKDKKAIGFRLYGQKINKQSLLPEGNVHEVAFAKVESEQILNNVIDPLHYYFPFRISPDRSSIALLTYLKEGDKTTAQVQLLDHDFNKLWKKQGPVGTVMLGGLIVLDNSSVIAIWHSYLPEPGKPAVSYQRYSKDLETVSMDLDIGSGTIKTLILKLNDQKQITACGFYAAKNESGTKGICLLHIDLSSMTMTDKKLVPLQLEDEKDDHEIQYGLQGMTINEQGEITLLSQAYSSINFSIAFYDITVYHLSAKGDILWTSVIPLNQFSDRDNAQYGSFVSMEKDGKTYILFNDNPANATVVKGGKANEYNTKKSGKVYLITLDAKGNFTREEFTSQVGEMMINVLESFQLDETNMLLYTDNKKTYQIDRVTFH